MVKWTEVRRKKAKEFATLCKEAGYAKIVREQAYNNICYCNDFDKALAYMTDLAKKKIEEQEFYTEVVGLIFDEEKLMARLKF